MELLSQIFPAQDFSLLGVILGLPAIGALVNGLFGKRLGKEAVTLMALSAVGGAFIAAVISFCMLQHASAGAHEHVRFYYKAWEWLSLKGQGPAIADFRDVRLDVAFSLDALNATMCLVITGIGFLIHLYSSKYMEKDPGYYRFFTYLNLFVFSMLVLVLGDSLPILFVGWEGVGLCSYLLIGFWFSEEANASAGKKAFITNRIGDFGLLIAMGLLAYYVGALDWAGIDEGRGQLLKAVKIWPVGDHVPIANLMPESIKASLNEARYVSRATLVALALFLGAMGKSAQFILHVWLPDAMAGPTPVSALIHAATMVTAGVYLLCRLSGVMVLSPTAMFIVAAFGAFTAFFAATIALVQNDIKKVLAYSTVSQLGYMFLGVGVGAFTAGFFHVLTHAFFKACLFLGAGSVIHAMHARIHDTDQSQDMRNMGGLAKFMPGTFITFVAAWAAIVGTPLTSGFFSKDEILYKAKTSFITGPDQIPVAEMRSLSIDNFVWTESMGTGLYLVGWAAAIMTAFYMTRLVIGTFLGEFKGWKIIDGWQDPHAHEAHAHAAHGHDAHDAHGHDDHGHDDHHHHETPGVDHMDGPVPHESPWQMTLPLWILGALAAFAGFLNAGALYHVTHAESLISLEHWLHPVFSSAAEVVAERQSAHGFFWVGLSLAIVAWLAGVLIAGWMYIQKHGEPAAQLQAKFPQVHAFLFDKWRVDEFYQETIIGALDSLAEICVWVDRWVVDGILARVTAFLVSLAGALLRQFQNGRVQTYSAFTVFGLFLVGCYVIAPHDTARVTTNHVTGKYAIAATPGFGYSYRWDADGDEKGEWDNKKFGSRAQVDFELSENTTRVVRLQVKNALGAVNEQKFEVTRPAPSLADQPTLRLEMTEEGLKQARPRSRGADAANPGAARPAEMRPTAPGKQRPPTLDRQAAPHGASPTHGAEH